VSGRLRNKESRRGRPTKLAELLRSAYPSKEPDDITAIRVFHWWKRAVPERVYMRARPVRMHAGTLYVNTATSAWSSELEVWKERLLASVRKHAPEAKVRAVRFRVGPLPDMPVGTRPERPLPPPVVIPVLPDQLARTLAAIDDDQLREAIGAAAGMALGRDAQR
jgi:Dna[CI] antecedent, DciA